MGDTIDFRQLIKVLVQRFLLIMCFVIIAIGVAAIFSIFFMKPIYEAETQLLINDNRSSGEDSSSDMLERDLQLINTYNIIIKSPAILDLVIEELELESEIDTLMKQISVSHEENSKVVNIKVEDEDPEVAVQIANSIAQVFSSQIPTIMSVDNVNILSEAKLSDDPQPVKPNILLNIVIGLFIGILVGVGIAFLLEFLDTTIKREQDVEEYLELPIIGVISTYPKEMDSNFSNTCERNQGGDTSVIQKD